MGETANETVAHVRMRIQSAVTNALSMFDDDSARVAYVDELAMLLLVEKAISKATAMLKESVRAAAKDCSANAEHVEHGELFDAIAGKLPDETVTATCRLFIEQLGAQRFAEVFDDAGCSVPVAIVPKLSATERRRLVRTRKGRTRKVRCVAKA